MVVRLLFLHHVRVFHAAIRTRDDGDRQRCAKYPVAVHRHFRINDAGHADFWLGSIKVSTKNIPAVGLLFFRRKYFDFFRRFHLRAK